MFRIPYRTIILTAIVLAFTLPKHDVAPAAAAAPAFGQSSPGELTGLEKGLLSAWKKSWPSTGVSREGKEP